MSIKVLKVLYRGANAKFMRQRLCLPRFSFDKPQYEKELNLEILFYRYMEMVGMNRSARIHQLLFFILAICTICT